MKGKKGFRSGSAYKTYYKLYKLGKWESNAEKALKRHIKAQPNDKAAIEALNRLDRNRKKYTRDRQSDGHICKVAPSIALRTSRGDDRLTVIQQMENIGFKYRGRRNKKTTRQSVARVR